MFPAPTFTALLYKLAKLNLKKKELSYTTAEQRNHVTVDCLVRTSFFLSSISISEIKYLYG